MAFTYKDAADFFREELKDGKCREDCPQCNAAALAIKACEKVSPKEIKTERWVDTKCECGYIFSIHHGDGYHTVPYENRVEFCPNCGQALEWMEDGGI